VIQSSAAVVAMGSLISSAMAASADIIPSSLALSHFAECVVKNAPDKVDRAMQSEVGGREERQILASLASSKGGCVTETNSLQFRFYQLRGALAERLILDDPSKSKALDSRISHPAVKAQATSTSPNWSGFFHCVVEAEPQKSLALFKSENASDDEWNIVLSMQPTLAACMPSNMTYRGNGDFLRRGMAVAAYALIKPPSEKATG